MPRFTPRRQEQIQAGMIAKVVARSPMSDVSNTSVWKHVLAAAARSDDEIYYQMVLLRLLFDLDEAEGDDLDERAKEIQPSIVTRDLSVKSVGNAVFYRTAVTGTVVIASGTVITTADNKQFKTTAAGSITASNPAQLPGHVTGQDSGLIPIIAVVAEADGNVEADTIVKFAGKPPGADGVTNPLACAFGADKESDDSFRNRIRQYISNLSRGTPNALEQAVIGQIDPDTGAKILFAKLQEDLVNRGYSTLHIDDGTGSAMTSEAVSLEVVTEGLPGDVAVGGETFLNLDNKAIDGDTLVLISDVTSPFVQDTHWYVNPASGQINFVTALTAGEEILASYTRYTGLIALAQNIVEGDPTDRVNYPGYRSAGTWTQVITPQVLIQVVQLSIVVKEGYDETEVGTAVKNAIRNYINGLGISGDVVVTEIVKLAKVAGVYDLTLTTPTTNQIVLDDQMARTTDANITVN